MVDALNHELTAPEALSSDVEAALRCLVSKLEPMQPRPRPFGDDTVHTDDVLLDVEVGDLRLLVLRRGSPSPMSLLSPREQEIARMVAQGYANKTIASVLDISSWTVASHLRRIFVKLHVSSRAAMATCLVAGGIDGLATPHDAMNEEHENGLSGGNGSGGNGSGGLGSGGLGSGGLGPPLARRPFRPGP